MLFTCVEDFFQAASGKPLQEEQELLLQKRISEGDEAARQELVAGCLPLIAARMRRRLPGHLQTLRAVYHYLQAIESAVAEFDFGKKERLFSEGLSAVLQRAEVCLIAEG